MGLSIFKEKPLKYKGEIVPYKSINEGIKDIDGYIQVDSKNIYYFSFDEQWIQAKPFLEDIKFYRYTLLTECEYKIVFAFKSEKDLSSFNKNMGVLYKKVKKNSSEKYWWQNSDFVLYIYKTLKKASKK